MDIVKSIHVATAFISISGFIMRGVWMMGKSPLLQRKWVRIVPHVNDTILLVTAIILAARLHQYPLVDNWLTAKLIALLLYIGLGMVALRYGKTGLIKINAFVLAVVVFSYIVMVAVTRNPLPFIT